MKSIREILFESLQDSENLDESYELAVREEKNIGKIDGKDVRTTLLITPPDSRGMHYVRFFLEGAISLSIQGYTKVEPNKVKSEIESAATEIFNTYSKYSAADKKLRKAIKLKHSNI